jgi:hypothetical protein
MVMASVPSIVCWESSEHRALVGASIASLIVYVMGVPAVTFGTVLYARRKDLLKNDKMMLALGFWYTWYGTYKLSPFGASRCLRCGNVCHRAELLLVGHCDLPPTNAAQHMRDRLPGEIVCPGGKPVIAAPACLCPLLTATMPLVLSMLALC